MTLKALSGSVLFGGHMGETRTRSGRAATKKFLFGTCERCGSPESKLNPAWLRAQRVEAGLTLRDVAGRLGYSAPYVCDIEKGRRNCLPKVRDFYEALS